ncbi:MAG: uroporphyrinogen-III synthase [Polaromonas sp.]|nr:uroporphyrinogen-III synthase [Polaromonas sp.]
MDISKKPRILVTRPAHDAAHWVDKLQQAGFDASALPLIEIAPASGADDARALQQAWRDIASYAACMFVSGNAADHFFKPNMLRAQGKRAQAAINSVASTTWQSVNPTLRFLAPGPGTAAALVANGVPAGQIDAPLPDATQFDSESLWAAVGQRDWRGHRVLIVRGATGDSDSAGASSAVGRDWIARQWQAAGAEVSFVSVYERRAPVFTQAQLQAAQLASADGSIWLFSSSEAVANLTRQSGLQAVNWSSARAVATHPRILEAVRSAGWGVALESRPALKDIVNTLRSIESADSSVYP